MEAAEDEELFRPPSPKYDERSFFFSAGAHPWAARTPSRRYQRPSGISRTPQSRGSSASSGGGGGSVSKPPPPPRSTSEAIGTGDGARSGGGSQGSEGAGTTAQSQPKVAVLLCSRLPTSGVSEAD